MPPRFVFTEEADTQLLENLQAATARLERGETFDPTAHDSVSLSICQDSIKNSVDDEADEQIDRVRETSPKYGDDWGFRDLVGC